MNIAPKARHIFDEHGDECVRCSARDPRDLKRPARRDLRDRTCAEAIARLERRRRAIDSGDLEEAAIVRMYAEDAREKRWAEVAEILHGDTFIGANLKFCIVATWVAMIVAVVG